MALTSFADVKQLLDNFVNNNRINIAGAQHGPFWDTTTYASFTGGNVPNVQDQNGNPIPILNKVNGKYDGPSSNIVMALAGTAGSPFDPNNPNAPIGRMPYPNGPYMPNDQIQEISDWITAQCPE
jgi:hypothetical protein